MTKIKCELKNSLIAVSLRITYNPPIAHKTFQTKIYQKIHEAQWWDAQSIKF